MLNTLVPFLNGLAGRLILGAFNLSSDHPLALCLLLSAVAGSAVAVLCDAAAPRP